MDINCGNCGETWDTAHLGTTAAQETDHPHPEIWNGELNHDWRRRFRMAGYVFGITIGILHQCPACTINEIEESTELGANLLYYDTEEISTGEFPDIFRG